MIAAKAPGVYVIEEPSGARPIEAVGTRTAGFVGKVTDKAAESAVVIGSYRQFLDAFPTAKDNPTDLSRAVRGFFQNGGGRCYVVDIGNESQISKPGERFGLELLAPVDDIAIVAAPGQTSQDAYNNLIDHCERLKDRVAILDAENVKDSQRIDSLAEFPTTSGGGFGLEGDLGGGGNVGLRPKESKNGFGAFYYPWLLVREGDKDVEVPPSGHMAGIWSRTDALRGVHKAPANEGVAGVSGLTYNVTLEEQEKLNPAGVNCIRSFARGGILVWGARTLADSSSPWKYIPVRRLFCMIEESIIQSTRWVVFEPNDEKLWKALRRDVGAFLRLLWKDGALMGRTPEEAFFVRCDYDTNTPDTINLGQVIVEVGIAPVRPAEFIVFKVSQAEIGGQADE